MKSFKEWTKDAKLTENNVNVGMQELMTTAKSILGQQEYSDFYATVQRVGQAINQSRNQISQTPNTMPSPDSAQYNGYYNQTQAYNGQYAQNQYNGQVAGSAPNPPR